MRDDDSAAVAETPGAVTEAQPDQAVTPENASTPQNVTEGQAAEGQTEGAPAATPATPEKVEPTEAEQAAAFDEFMTKAKAAVEQVDRSTGSLPDGFVADVKAAYVALPIAKNKTAARNWLDAGMKDALTKPPFDPFKAKAFLDLNEACRSTGANRETVAKPPVNPTEAFVEEVTAHWLATSLLIPGPEVDASYVAQAQALAKSLEDEAKVYKKYLTDSAAWLAKPEAERGEEPKAPEVHKVILHAAKIALGRGARRTSPKPASGTAAAAATAATYTGPKRDVKAHIREAFENVPVGGFLKIGEISKFKSQAYGESTVSGGAINAALQSPKFAESVTNIVRATEGGVNGARKIA